MTGVWGALGWQRDAYERREGFFFAEEERNLRAPKSGGAIGDKGSALDASSESWFLRPCKKREEGLGGAGRF